MSREVKTLMVGEGEDGSRLDRFIKRRWPHISHIQFQKLIRSGQIRVDGGRVKPDHKLQTGAIVRIPPLPDTPDPDALKRERAKVSPNEARYIRSMILYEDEEVIALNKPSGLAVQGGTKTKDHIDRLLGAFGEGLERPRLVHRLDRDTSGVLMLGKTPKAAASLSGSFAKRRVKKTYWALVAGEPNPREGLIDQALMKQGFHDREIVRPVDANEMGAEEALTEFVTISRAGGKISWLALRPHSGRTHQLRAHMNFIGHSILGDPKYGSDISTALSQGLGLQLHHRRIEIPHPSQGNLIIEAPLDPIIKAGFERYGFDEYEASADPFMSKPPRPTQHKPHTSKSQSSKSTARRPRL